MLSIAMEWRRAAACRRGDRGATTLLHTPILSSSQPNVDLGRKRAVNRTLCRNIHQRRMLFCTQRAAQIHFDIDSIHHSVPGFALVAVFRVNT